MDEGRLASALDRAEHALGHIERSLEEARRSDSRDEQLRARVREAVAELDQLIREAS
jgi:multidrug resistance efflux pump